MGAEGLTYTQYLYSISSDSARQAFLNLGTAVTEGEITPAQFASQVETLSGKTVQIHRNAAGDVLGYTLHQTPTYTTTNPLNSNVSTVARGTVSMPVSTGINQSGKAITSRLAGVGTKVATGAAMVGTAAMCVGAGITLGKTIDSLLYNANPDFWNSVGMSTLNPETWRTITAGDDSFGASVMNVLFGFDDDGNGQAYMDENALAYFAAYMNYMGAFSTTGSVEGFTPSESGISLVNNDLPYPVMLSDPYEHTIYSPQNREFYVTSNDAQYAIRGLYQPYNYQSMWIYSDTTPVTWYDSATGSRAGSSFTINGKTIYYGQPFGYQNAGTNLNPPANYDMGNRSGRDGYLIEDFAKILYFNEYDPVIGIPGIGTQSGATTPQLSGSDVSTTLAELRQQYPDLWNNAITYPVIQDDGSVKNYTYVPVALPEDFTRTGTQPESGTSSQTHPEIDPSVQVLIDELTKILVNPFPQTEPDADNPNPPENPTDTGDGSSPISVIPSGSASSLWAIYHPTQAQIDAFGAWLWSSNFIDQILKIFNNPMEAVIGLHKVYATPIDAGTRNIKVGYLDSGVSSAYITEQYVTVDCGSVDLGEQFGNVFDYSPFTDVQLYLPFVGIVPLNVEDVMRSTISIEYGVDVITGACLAMVEVSRDGNSSVLYQYAGNCAVQYPISSGSYMGIVTSIVSIAGGIAATAATGGGAAPIALGAAGALMNAHTSVQHSGSFSGNSGAMGGKVPYLIISRPQTKVADYFESMQGYPTNAYTTVGDCSGYIRAISAHVVNVTATDDELDMINELLYSGIII